jgi:hypothetical protein
VFVKGDLVTDKSILKIGIVMEALDGYPGTLEPWYADLYDIPYTRVFWFDSGEQLLYPQDELRDACAQGYSRVIQN